MAVLIVLAALALSGCLFTPPEELEASVVGDYYDGDALHRPGQPCLLCHGADAPRPEPAFEIAGTVYDEIDSLEDEGVGGVLVIITDADGVELVVTTNSAGNFYSARQLEFPLTVSIRRGDVVSTMQTLIWRNGSCAHCHGEKPDEASVGRVFLDEEMTP